MNGFIRKTFAVSALCMLLQPLFSQSEKKNPGIIRGEYAALAPVEVNGGVALYIAKNKKSLLPVFSMNGNMETTEYTLFVDSKPYRLNRLKNVEKKFFTDTNTLGVSFEQQNLFRVIIVYQIQKKHEKQSYDTVNVSWSVENLSGSAHSFSLKYAMDTNISEGRDFQFVCASGKKIKTETVITDFRKDSWVISSDGANALQLIFSGRGITSPDRLVFANRNIIMESLDSTVFVPGRSFNSLVSYNDSAVGIFFRKADVDSGKTMKGSFAMAFSTNDFQMAGFQFSYSEDNYTGVQAEITDVPSGNFEGSEEAVKAIRDNIEGVSAVKMEEVPEAEIEAKYSQEHIKELLDYIDQLETEGSSINSSEIEQLEAEVDEILEYLRNRK